MALFDLFKSPKADLVLDVQGLNCKNCEMKISKIVSAVPGIKDFEASSKTKTLSVHWQNKTQADPEVIVKALEEAGYPSTPRVGNA